MEASASSSIYILVGVWGGLGCEGVPDLTMMALYPINRSPRSLAIYSDAKHAKQALCVVVCMLLVDFGVLCVDFLIV